MKFVDEIILKAYKQYPDLASPEKEKHNLTAKILKETCIVEAINLKASVQYLLGDVYNAQKMI